MFIGTDVERIIDPMVGMMPSRRSEKMRADGASGTISSCRATNDLVEVLAEGDDTDAITGELIEERRWRRLEVSSFFVGWYA